MLRKQVCNAMLAISFAAVASTTHAQSHPDVRLRAFAKANEALAKAHLATSGTVVISERRGYIVVSYVQTDHDVRGGGAHVVYDPRSDKVVYVLGED